MLHEIRTLGERDAPDVIDVLVESFYDYPVMRFVLGSTGDYEERLRALTDFFVRARLLRNEWMLGISDHEGLVAAATIARAHRESPPEVDRLREQAWDSIGFEARRRYEIFGEASGPFEVPEPHLHLSQIGVRTRRRGHGLGRALLDATHRLSAEDPEAEGVALTTEVERNISLYQHFGYEVVGKTVVPDAFTTWGFYRPDPRPSASRTR